MNLKEYQEFTKTTAVYPPSKAIEYLALGLTSEAGEVAGVIKRYLRGDVGVHKGTMKSLTSKRNWRFSLVSFTTVQRIGFRYGKCNGV